uniref:ATP-dependent DNA helicase 2 subunit KU70 isoform X1 n=1 Tax=Tanacetum cinerariifolium TaxID=118510 RepID=A0A6L2LRC7_TANCI|nr:ATP-dependent DNA helicase 2 subunit KU70 isoform X1 [Tanacetum cinerariifolium]
MYPPRQKRENIQSYTFTLKTHVLYNSIKRIKKGRNDLPFRDKKARNEHRELWRVRLRVMTGSLWRLVNMDRVWQTDLDLIKVVGVSEHHLNSDWALGAPSDTLFVRIGMQLLFIFKFKDMNKQLRKRVFKKRRVRGIAFMTATGLSIEVNTYALIRPTIPVILSCNRSKWEKLNKCLTGKRSGYDSLRLSQAQILWGLYHKRNVDFAYLMWEDFVYQVEHKDTKKSNKMYYPRFTKVIIHHFMSKDPSIPRRNKVNWHYVRDDHMFSTIKLVSRHQNTQQFGALLPIELTNEDIRNSNAYKEYYAVATGATPPKPKASDDEEEGGDDEQEYDEEEFIHPSLSTPAEEEPMDEESFDPIPKTPEDTNDEGNGEEDLGLNVGREEGHDEEEEEDKLYRDVNINQGRGIQTTQKVEDSHVTLTLVNPDDSNLSGPLPMSAPTITSSTIATITVTQQAPLPPTTASSTLLQDLPNFGSLFGFDNRLKTLEANFSKIMQTNQFAGAVSSIPGITIDENMQKIIKEQVKEQVKVQVSKILPRIEQTVNEQLKAEVLTRSSNSSKTSYAVVIDLSEIELKKILIEKMEGNKSIHRSNEQRNLYKDLVEAYESDKIILDTYGDTITLKRRRDDDADKDEEPSAGLDRGSKRRRDGKEPESASAPQETATRSAGRNHQLQIVIGIRPCRLPTEAFNRGSANSRMDTLTPKLLAGPTYELLNWSCKSLEELEYYLEKVYKDTTDQLDWVNLEGQQYPHNLLKPLPLIPNNRGRHVIPFDHFINNDLEYLRGGASCRYDKHALWGVSHWGRKRQQFYGFSVNRESARDVYSKRRIIAVTELKIVERVEDLQLGVESYQKKLNLTKLDTYRSDVKRKEAYIAYSNPRGFIYQNKDKKNMLMRIDELHKFSDGMLIDVRTALDDRLKGIRMQYMPQSIWRKSDKDRAAAMIQAINKRLKTRRIIRSLERSILTDLQVTPTKHGRMIKPYSSHHFIANCFNAENIKMEVKIGCLVDIIRIDITLWAFFKCVTNDKASSEGGSANETNETETPTPTHEGVSTNMMAAYFVRDGLRRRDKKTNMLLVDNDSCSAYNHRLTTSRISQNPNSGLGSS